MYQEVFLENILVGGEGGTKGVLLATATYSCHPLWSLPFTYRTTAYYCVWLAELYR